MPASQHPTWTLITSPRGAVVFGLPSPAQRLPARHGGLAYFTSDLHSFIVEEDRCSAHAGSRPAHCPLIATGASFALSVAAQMSAYQAPAPACRDGSDQKGSSVKQKRQQVSVACLFCQMRKCKVCPSSLDISYSASLRPQLTKFSHHARSATDKNHPAQRACARMSNARTRLMAI